MLYSLICGHDNMDATSAYRDYPDFAAALQGSSVAGLKIGLPKEYFGAGIDDTVKAAVSSSDYYKPGNLNSATCTSGTCSHKHQYNKHRL